MESRVVLHAAGPVDSNTAGQLQEPLLRAAEGSLEPWSSIWRKSRTLAAPGLRVLLLAAKALKKRGEPAGDVEIRLSSRQPITPAAIGHRRLDLYDRTLGWLGGGLECSQRDANFEFVYKSASASFSVKCVID